MTPSPILRVGSMNDADSKKLEEMREQHRQNPKLSAPKQALINALEYHLAEQDREIERLQRVFKDVCVEAGERQEKLEKAEAELEECHGRLMAYRDSTTELIASEQTLKAEREKLIGAAQALIDYVHNKYPGEELRCPYMKALEAALVEVKEKRK